MLPLVFLTLLSTVLLVNMRSDIKPHLSEPVFTAGINRRLSSPVVCLFLSSLAKRVKLKVCPNPKNTLDRNLILYLAHQL